MKKAPSSQGFISNFPENMAASIEFGSLVSVWRLVVKRWPPTFSSIVEEKWACSNFFDMASIAACSWRSLAASRWNISQAPFEVILCSVQTLFLLFLPLGRGSFTRGYLKYKWNPENERNSLNTPAWPWSMMSAVILILKVISWFLNDVVQTVRNGASCFRNHTPCLREEALLAPKAKTCR